jgi:hypothetical protein
VSFAEQYARKTPGELVASCTPAMLRVAQALAVYADRHGRAWPGLRTLAAELGRSPGSIKEMIDALIAADWVVVVEHDTGRRRVLELRWLSTGARVSRGARGLRAPRATLRAQRVTAVGAVVTRAEQEQEQDHEQAAVLAPTSEGRAIIASIRAELAGRGQPAGGRARSDVGRRRAVVVDRRLAFERGRPVVDVITEAV